MKHCAPTICLSIAMVLIFKTRFILSLKLKVAIPFTILYQLTKFEAPSYNDFRNSLISIFQCPNSQRVITIKNLINLFHKVIYLLSSISWPSLRLPDVIFFEIFLFQVFNGHSCKGQKINNFLKKSFTRQSTHYLLSANQVWNS